MTAADSAHLHRLLDLQAEDTAITRLTEERAKLPAALRLAEQTNRLEELDSDLRIATKQRDEVTREQPASKAKSS